MKQKNSLRKKFILLRKKRYKNLTQKKFTSLISYIKKRYSIKKRLLIGIYYPSNYEINIFPIMKFFNLNKTLFLLPRIKKNNTMIFNSWKNKDTLVVNKFGIPEPLNNHKEFIPDILLVPLLAFDKKRNRLGYGKGFYDKYLNGLKNKNKNIEAIGIAFSFQKYKSLPSTKFDYRLNNVFTEKGFLI